MNAREKTHSFPCHQWQLLCMQVDDAVSSIRPHRSASASTAPGTAASRNLPRSARKTARGTMRSQRRPGRLRSNCRPCRSGGSAH
eukprot:6205074-Pleurochrysis_carterae.AAC.3